MSDNAGNAAAQTWLEEFVRAHGGVAGSVHYRSGENLLLAAAVNIPEPVRNVTAVVPRGKGMAGLALERNRPVSVCNIQTDRSGDVRPGARAVNAQAAAALPIHDPAGDVRAVVGIAFMRDEDLPETELQRLTQAASTLPASS
jgi:L-methionine (R)-S-oxide reductase